MYKSLIFFLLLGLSAVLISCHTDQSPKPAGYPRIHFPTDTGHYVYQPQDCPYTFELPDYMRVEKKEKFFEEDVSGNCWFNLICDTLNATIYLSYKELDQRMSLLNLMEDAYRLTYKHTNKADYIQPRELDNGHGGVGLIYYVGGDAASNIQFFITDTTQHFVRGALYFYAHPNADSLQPVIRFMVDDIDRMLDGWRWQ